jgi:cytoskeletal protein RodZ
LHVSIGQSLTAARERAGLTVEQVSDATRIRRTLVYAIEMDDFSRLGGDFYTRGHIRTIAVTVGADPDALLAEYDAEHDRVSAPRATEVFESETAARPERRGPNWSAAMAAALVLVVIYGVIQVISDDGGGSDARAVRSDGASTLPRSAPASPSVVPSGGPSAVAQAPRDRVTVVLKAHDRSWVQVSTASGQELYQGLVQGGQARTFTDRNRLKLVVGDAGAVTLTVNGTAVGAPGRPGQVVRVQFSAQDPVGG